MLDTNFSSRPINSANRIDARKYLYETFNEKLKEKNNDPAMNKEINKFISEYEKQLFKTSKNDYAKYIRELDKLLENLKLSETLFQSLISIEISRCELAQMSEEQTKQLEENNTNNEGKYSFIRIV